MTFFWEGGGGGTNIRKGLDLGAKSPLLNICPVPPPRAVYFNVDRECLGRNADGGTRGINVSGAYNLMFSLTPVPAQLTCFIIFFSKKLVSLPPLPRVLISSWDMHKSGVFQPTSTSGSFMVPRFGREKNWRDAITQRPFYQSLQRFQDKGKSEAKKIATLHIKTQFFICRWINLRCPVAKISCCWYA